MKTLICSILLGFCAVCIGVTPVKELVRTQDLLRQTLNSLRGILQFYHREIATVNLDAIIGTRIVDGTLAVLLYRIEHDPASWPIDGAMLQEIRAVQALAETVSDIGVPHIQASSPMYFTRIGGILQRGFWRINFASKDLRSEDFSRTWAPREGELLDLLYSDMCIAELFGTGPNTRLRCQISPQCWEMMTRMGYNGYSLSHEIFYLMIGYQVGCVEQMERQRILFNQPSLDNLISTYCAATWLEFSEIERHNIPPMKRDIYIEQAALCGMVGYRQFFSQARLVRLINWQDPQSGCYKNPEVHGMSSAPPVGRKKREERMLRDGCLSHLTSVAASALVQYVRYLAEHAQTIAARRSVAIT